MMKFAHYDLVIVGSSFASSFYLKKVLESNSNIKKILVLERGQYHSLQWQKENNRSSELDSNTSYERQGLDHKKWQFTLGFGGSSNCWSGCTPRMLPNDFKLFSQYGQGIDWPISYDELEPYYCEAEKIMAISGPSDWALSPRSMEFPQPPHNLSDPDKLLKQAYPEHFYAQATARPRRSTSNRPACCASASCHRCPIDSKFTIQNELKYLYDDPRVELLLGAEVERLAFENDKAKGVYFTTDKEYFVSANHVALGANAIFNAAILLRSGDTHPLVGKRLHEQLGTTVRLHLDGIDGLQGSTFVPGQGYMFYDGEHRRDYGGCILESINAIQMLRTDFGKWRQVMELVFIVEDLPLQDNYVSLGEDGRPILNFSKYSDYGLTGLSKVPDYIHELAKVLPIEEVFYSKDFENGQMPRATEAHIQGTVMMGQSKEDSVVDKSLIHHQYRNLQVLGSSAFPTGAPANPTLTLSAMSLMAAEAII